MIRNSRIHRTSCVILIYQFHTPLIKNHKSDKWA